MAMVTRCPACSTVFRVAPEQLQAQQGLVRCGRCMTVFDGFKSLSTETDALAPEEPASAEPPAAAPATSAPAPAGVATPELEAMPQPVEIAPPKAAEPEATSSPAAVTTLPLSANPPTPQPATSPAPAFKLEPVSATELAAAAAPAAARAARDDTVEDAGDFGPPPEQLTIEDHLFLEQRRERQARNARLWAVGVALLLLVLAAQAVYVYRGELAARYPAARPYLARMCEPLRCSVLLPQNPRAIAIEASDLQASDPARPGLIQLTATVRNHSTQDLGFPALDLVLTNTREHTLARRIFLPGDYLEPGRDVRAGIPASAEFTIRLDLDTGDLNPAGFRLDLLPAPAP